MTTLAAALDAPERADDGTTPPLLRSDVADAIWRRSPAEQHDAICDDETCNHNESPEEG